jgi:hypothetical protein
MENNIEYLDKVIGIIEKPYFKELGLYGVVDIYEQEYVFSKIYCDKISIDGNVIIDSENNERYLEDNEGGWLMNEYNGNESYYMNNCGFWNKSKYDINGNKIYFENSDGEWSKYEYDSNGNCLYYEYIGGWFKKEFDEKSYCIYWENSSGIILDTRRKDEK